MARRCERDPVIERATAIDPPRAPAVGGVQFRLMTGELAVDRVDLLLAGEQADLVYGDPPWGPGNLMYWRTQNGETARPSWPAFLNTLASSVRRAAAPGAHVFLEMGVRWVDELARAMEAVGVPETARWSVQYGNPRRPNVLWYAGPGAPCDPTSMAGEPMTMHVLATVARPCALVFDPCTGKGMTARCALKLGMRFAGIELNPNRAAVAQRWAARWEARRR